MTTRLLVGDVFARLTDIPAGTVDLVLTSPPFLALRSYLPDGHPDKAKEIGSETTPADFLDTLLALTAEWGRVLAPHGSIAVELGDSYSGSGGAGGDYGDDGWRGGQPKFGGSASRARESRWSLADALWLAGVIDTEGSIIVHKQDRGGNSPSYRTDVCVSMMDREVCDRAAELTGVGNVNRDGRGVYSWHVSAQQARYVLTNIWPHLLIKQRQAKAAIEMQRHIEEFRGRGTHSPLSDETIAYREMIRGYVSGLNARGDDRGKYVPTWTPPTPPRVRHATQRSIGWPLEKSLCGIPTLYGACLAYGVNLLTGEESPAGKWRIRNVKPWIRSNPPVGALGDKERPATSYVIVATRTRDRYFDLDAVRTATVTNLPPARGNNTKGSDSNSHRFAERVNDNGGAPPRDWWHHVDAVLDACLDDMARRPPTHTRTKGIQARSGKSAAAERGGNCSTLNEVEQLPSDATGARGVHLRRALERAGILRTLEAVDVSPKGYSGAHYAVWPPELVRLLVDEMCPRRVCVTCGQPSLRLLGKAVLVDQRGHEVAPADRTHDDVQGSGSHNKRDGGKTAVRPTVGWSDCDHDTWRPGLVLDPFAGSGTTLAVCSGMGRDSIGIDLDARNADLARQRVGMFLDVDTAEPEPADDPDPGDPDAGIQSTLDDFEDLARNGLDAAS